VAVDEHQAYVTGVVAQPGHDAQQCRAVAAVDEREAARAQYRSHFAIERVGHGQQCRLVDKACRRSPGRIRVGQYQVVVVDHVVMVEGVAQARVAKRGRRAGLMAAAPIAVEWNSNQLDVGHRAQPPMIK
jgi:hypothetical protein